MLHGRLGLGLSALRIKVGNIACRLAPQRRPVRDGCHGLVDLRGRERDFLRHGGADHFCLRRHNGACSIRCLSPPLRRRRGHARCQRRATQVNRYLLLDLELQLRLRCARELKFLLCSPSGG